MNITKIELYNFRNYEKKTLNNLKKINMIIGDNGVGKTSILEGIYLCSIGKSFRTSYDNSIIKAGKQNYKVNVTIKDNNIKNNLEINCSKKNKNTKIDNNQTKKLSDFIGKYKVILFSPDEVKIIKDSPSRRRNYLNIELSQLEKLYLKYLKDYNAIVKQKNEYLKEINLNFNMDKKYLDILDEKLVTIGLKIYEYRKKYIEDINNSINKVTVKNNVRVVYNSDFNKSKEELLKEIKNNRNKEMMFGMSIIGIHRDDIEFLLNDNNAKEFASQGQLKMIMLYLKLAEIDIFINKYNYKPILLLDDLFSELDSNNQNLIIEKLSKKTQIFITTTDVSKIKEIGKINIIDLKEEVNNE